MHIHHNSAELADASQQQISMTQILVVVVVAGGGSEEENCLCAEENARHWASELEKEKYCECIIQNC